MEKIYYTMPDKYDEEAEYNFKATDDEDDDIVENFQ